MYPSRPIRTPGEVHTRVWFQPRVYFFDSGMSFGEGQPHIELGDRVGENPRRHHEKGKI